MLNNRVRAIREAHGLSQPQLAQRSGVSNRLITALETERGYRPNFIAAEALCAYFDVPLGHLFFFDWEHERPARATSDGWPTVEQVETDGHSPPELGQHADESETLQAIA